LSAGTIIGIDHQLPRDDGGAAAGAIAGRRLGRLKLRAILGRVQRLCDAGGWLLFLTILGCAGCMTVKPYQREFLAQPGMSFGADAQNESLQHMLESREASFGGYGASGGGCGCN
jgi:hypothetical protein